MCKKQIINLATVFLLLFVTGCESSIDAVNEERGIYSIYGYLDLNKDTNYVRVKDLNKNFLQDTTENIDAEVTLKDLDNGLTDTLQDTVVEFDGVKTHNFRVTTDLKFDNKYRFSVISPDGSKKVTADATTPYDTDVNLEPDEDIECDTFLTLTFEPVRSKYALDVYAGFHYGGEIVWAKLNTLLEENGETVLLRFAPIFLPKVRLGDQNFLCREFSSQKFYIRYIQYGPDLFDDTVSDSLHIPGGAGRFGALYRDEFPFEVDIYSELE